MQTVENFVPITQAKSKLLDMVRSIHDQDDSFVITKNGVPEAVMISMKKFEGLLETIEILADQEAMIQLRDSMADVKQGRIVDADEII
jgi:prevent-host-death family protein